MSVYMPNDNSEDSLQDIIGESLALKQMLQLAMKVAQSDAPVLILGEAGSGKELIARGIHRISIRRNESFVKLNCAPAGEGMLGTELFGDMKEAESEAGKIGRLEAADRGILFLDEIAQVPLNLQAKLLRLLERREFERVGSTHGIRVNVRLIASTKYDLAERVAGEMFRDDLYEQLNAFPIPVPPLRERRDDIPLLARYFVQKFARRRNKNIESIPVETVSFLQGSEWPGNVRQLENWIDRAVALTTSSELQVPPAELGP
jgi:formate hydrogenlyase transcriptional activator